MMSEDSEKIASSDTLDKPLFRDITAEDYDPEITEIESLCISCEEQGVTRLFLTKIPFFREVIVASFTCDHCGYRNAELQPGGKIQDRGVSFKVTVKNVQDLNRQVVHTAHASLRIPTLDFEMPPGKSGVTTIESVIDSAIKGLEQDQVLRKIQHPELAVQIDDFIQKLRDLKSVKSPFQFVIDDPSGNSFLENPLAPSRDPELVVAHYARTRAQDEALGLTEDEVESETPENSGTSEGAGAPVVGQDDGEGFNSQNEVLAFSINCYNCGSACFSNMKVVNIPHFKEVVVMATVCDKCGYRDSEVKSACGVSPKGQRYELTMNTVLDMSRDVLKSETSSLSIPELEFETDMGTLGGKFTTVEGLLQNVKSQLKEANPFYHGDSSQPGVSQKFVEFFSKIDKIITGEITGYHFILDDPAGNSYIQSLTDPEPDPQLRMTSYDRNFQQNEDLGLNDMKTEDYETS